ncbi:MAG: hypothetical protein H0X25_20575 [Acidobacteriales bacterium]|nr:hypothetical protein [Terriglobales bacterium]
MIRHSQLAPLAVIACAATLYAGKPETLSQLVARAEAAKPQDSAALYLEAAQRQLTSADQLYIDGKVGQAEAAVADVVKFSTNAAQATMQSRKKLTGTEIAIRKMSQKLLAIRRTLSFEDQPAVQMAADQLEKLRTDLLSAMFQKE